VLRAEPECVARLAANIDRLHAIAAVAGIPGIHPVGRRSQIIAFTLSKADADNFDTEAGAAGLCVPRMRYPGGPSPEYHRIAVRATHTDAVLTSLASLLAGRRYL
jgi:7-keto-8-aminopelargonate synthetase-like enzyme